MANFKLPRFNNCLTNFWILSNPLSITPLLLPITKAPGYSEFRQTMLSFLLSIKMKLPFIIFPCDILMRDSSILNFDPFLTTTPPLSPDNVILYLQGLVDFVVCVPALPFLYSRSVLYLWLLWVVATKPQINGSHFIQEIDTGIPVSITHLQTWWEKNTKYTDMRHICSDVWEINPTKIQEPATPGELFRSLVNRSMLELPLIRKRLLYFENSTSKKEAQWWTSSGFRGNISIYQVALRLLVLSRAHKKKGFTTAAGWGTSSPEVCFLQYSRSHVTNELSVVENSIVESLVSLSRKDKANPWEQKIN